MNTPINSIPELSVADHSLSQGTRPLFWSVRRELWENRSIYLVPSAAAAIFMLVFVITFYDLPTRRAATLRLPLSEQKAILQKPYDETATMLIAISLIVGVIYCLDAVYGERRDRSILFWKSLPISDGTALLAKLAIPIAVMPLLVFVLTLLLHISMFLSSNLVLMLNGVPSTTLTQMPLHEHTVILLYGLITLALWHAPIYAWLILMSAWARRVPLLWAVLPQIMVMILETILFRTQHFASFLGHRLVGHFPEAFLPGREGSIDSVAQMTPERFCTLPALWIGLLFAAMFLAVAVQLRRSRAPI
jgi:ABC-2 type transport system permease protein